MQGHEISFFNLLLFFASGRFSIPLPTAVQACEWELPTGSLLPTDLLKDLNSHEKTPDDKVIWYVTVIQPPTG